MYLPGKKSPHIMDTTVFTNVQSPDSSAAAGSSAALFSRATKKYKNLGFMLLVVGACFVCFPQMKGNPTYKVNFCWINLLTL